MALSYPAHALLQLSGVIGSNVSPIEIWSTSLRLTTKNLLGQPVDLSYDTQEAWLDFHLNELKSWFSDPDTAISSNCQLTQVKFNAISPGGHYLHSQTSERTVSGTQGGVTPTTTVPLQIAMVVSLGTDFARGYASRGRMYLPAPALLTNANYVWNSAPIQAVAQSTAHMLSDISNEGGIPDTINIVPAVVSGLSGGASNTITTVAVDTKPDTQRRRANAVKGAKFTYDV